MEKSSKIARKLWFFYFQRYRGFPADVPSPSMAWRSVCAEATWCTACRPVIPRNRTEEGHTRPGQRLQKPNWKDPPC